MHGGWIENKVAKGSSSHDKTACGQLVKLHRLDLPGLINPGLFLGCFVFRIRVVNKVTAGRVTGSCRASLEL